MRPEQLIKRKSVTFEDVFGEAPIKIHRAAGDIQGSGVPTFKLPKFMEGTEVIDVNPESVTFGMVGTVKLVQPANEKMNIPLLYSVSCKTMAMMQNVSKLEATFGKPASIITVDDINRFIADNNIMYEEDELDTISQKQVEEILTNMSKEITMEQVEQHIEQKKNSKHVPFNIDESEIQSVEVQTIVTLTDGTVGIAKFNPDDTFSTKLGIEIAYVRAKNDSKVKAQEQEIREHLENLRTKLGTVKTEVAKETEDMVNALIDAYEESLKTQQLHG